MVPVTVVASLVVFEIASILVVVASHWCLGLLINEALKGAIVLKK
jgi:hypothetical protein